MARRTVTTGIDADAVPSGPGCVECDDSSGWWVHLRRCAECGHIGCCDSSPGRHATEHFALTGHAVIRSFEPGEAWFWNYATAAFTDGPSLAPPQSRPLAQGAPAPADRVPADWRDLAG